MRFVELCHHALVGAPILVKVASRGKNRANFEHQILPVLLTEIGRSVRSLLVAGCSPQARNQWSPASQA